MQLSAKPAIVKSGFLWNRDGSVAPLFGLCITALIWMAGLAIDSARAYRTSADTASSLDAAALAAAKALRLEKATDAELRAVAERYFHSNFSATALPQATYNNFRIEADRDRSAVKVFVDVELPTTIGVLLGDDKFEIPGSSTAIYEAKDIELAMMLDVSGSMRGTKITDLHAAASDLVKILLAANESGAEHRIAIAPFSNSVNAGSFSSNVSDDEEEDASGKKKKSKGAGTSCVTERPGDNAFSDKSPSSKKLGKKASSCPASSVFPLSNVEDELVEHIEGMTVDGATAGHLGIGWAWYLLSPEWASIWPAESEPKAYNDKDVQKAVILMTDGEFNTAYEQGNGDSKQQSEELCDNLKIKGVTVYTVGFQAPAEALPILQYCATSPSHFFDARDGTQLRDTFKTIAKRLSALRLES